MKMPLWAVMVPREGKPIGEASTRYRASMGIHQIDCRFTSHTCAHNLEFIHSGFHGSTVPSTQRTTLTPTTVSNMGVCGCVCLFVSSPCFSPRLPFNKRARPAHPVTGLPRGATLIVTPTKEAAWEWTNRLESGVGGLSVLSYVMPLRERRKLSAKQAAAFDVVVTTYDVSSKHNHGFRACSSSTPSEHLVV